MGPYSFKLAFYKRLWRLKYFLKRTFLRKYKPIFLIVTFQNYNIENNNISIISPHPVGFYHSKKQAIKAVESNSCDMNECDTYPYVMIEEINPGVYPDVANRWFYKWENKKYISIKVPDIMSFSLLSYIIG